MKKIFNLAAIATIALSLFACKVDDATTPAGNGVNPNAMAGNWYYTEIDTSSCTASTVTLIFNNSGKQTENVADVPKTGEVAYIWDQDGTTATANTRTDKPTNSSLDSTNKLVVWCFSNASVNAHCFGDGGFTAASWPGALMTKNGEAPVSKISYTVTLTVSGINTAKAVLNGEPSSFDWTGWPFLSWKNNDQTAVDGWITAHGAECIKDADGDGKVIFTYTDVTYPNSTRQIMIVEADYTGTAYTNGRQTSNLKYTVPATAGNYKIDYTFTASDASTLTISAN